MEETLALVIAFAASFCTNYSTYMQKKAVDTLPRLKVRLTRAVIHSFITNRQWVSAMVMDGVGTALFMVALIFLPVSIVEPIITAGIGLLAYLAIKNLGERPTLLDFSAIGMTVLGVIFLAVSLAEGLPKHHTYNALELWTATAAILFVAVAIPLVLQLTSKGNIAAALGLFIGVAGVFSRLLMGDFGGQWYLWLPVCILTYPLGFALFQSGLQRGRAVVVAPIYNGLVLCVPVVLGMIALNESLPNSPALTALRIAAFALIACGAVVLSRRTAASRSAQEVVDAEEARLEA
jgi:drug/metabolite transporter (DMT)-like permease